jgi:hypothetical protein
MTVANAAHATATKLGFRGAGGWGGVGGEGGDGVGGSAGRRPARRVGAGSEQAAWQGPRPPPAATPSRPLLSRPPPRPPHPWDPPDGVGPHAEVERPRLKAPRAERDAQRDGGGVGDDEGDGGERQDGGEGWGGRGSGVRWKGKVRVRGGCGAAQPGGSYAAWSGPPIDPGPGGAALRAPTRLRAEDGQPEHQRQRAHALRGRGGGGGGGGGCGGGVLV